MRLGAYTACLHDKSLKDALGILAALGLDSAFLAIRDYQWNEVAIPFWKKVQSFAAGHDVKVCLEMHPGNVVFNPRTPERLATEIGATHIGGSAEVNS